MFSRKYTDVFIRVCFDFFPTVNSCVEGRGRSSGLTSRLFLSNLLVFLWVLEKENRKGH